jgi:hypothetical protein
MSLTIFLSSDAPMLVNLSNHPSGFWSEEQLAAARQFGDIVDVPFPNIDPSSSSSTVHSIADKAAGDITAMAEDIVVHVMGEMTFTYAVVSRLKALGIHCIASTTERKTTFNPDGTKVSEFQFVKFREY